MLTRHPKSAALIAGFLSATGFAPLNLWPVTLACFALLIWLIERAPNARAAFVRGWLFGLGHFTVGNNWIAHAFSFQDAMPHWFGYGAVIALALYLAVYPALATLAAWWLSRRFPAPQERASLAFILIFAAAWLVSEYLRAVVFTGFAWNPLGVVWLPTGLAVASTIIGTYGISALAILAAGAILLLVRRSIVPALLILAPLVLVAILGFVTLHRVPPPQPNAPAIRIVQPNIGQQDKHVAAYEDINFRKLATLSGRPSPRARLLFWPEAAIPAYLDMEPEWRGRLAALLGPNDLLLTGGTKVYIREENKGLYTDRVLAGANNSLWVLTPQGRLVGKYDKAHLVPYGEYLPMRDILQPLGLSRLVPGDADFWPGPGPRSLALPAAAGRAPLSMGVQICYEIIFSGHVVDKANRPDFLFNPSNDAWFGSWGPPQHLAQARLRAIEEAMPILRSTPTGISAVIDAQGRLLRSLPHGEAGFIDSSLPPAAAPTLFSRVGNLTSFAFALLLLALAVATRRTRR